MNRRAWGWTAGLVAILAWTLSARTAVDTDASEDRAINALTLQTGSAGFARADAARRFEFPRDHAAHPDFRSEWWYFSGHLQDDQGHPFGFQLTLFRFALAATTPPSPSAWRSSQVLLGHFAVSDIEGKKFHAYERMTRTLPAVAGTRATPVALWLDDWRIENFTRDGADCWRLIAAQDGVELQLELTATTAVVLQGEAGLSRKSAAPGNASYYYSVPRLAAQGTLKLANHEHAVSGSAWLDREWSTSALSRAQAGWDWFALQLGDGASLMFYRLRKRDGSAEEFSAGTYVDTHGKTLALGATDVKLETTGAWLSPHSGRRYPKGWRLRVARAGLDLKLAPRLADQEWQGRFRYWEGAVTVASDGQAAGLGYVELTGY